jgi:uncharacterized protein
MNRFLNPQVFKPLQGKMVLSILLSLLGWIVLSSLLIAVILFFQFGVDGISVENNLDIFLSSNLGFGVQLVTFGFGVLLFWICSKWILKQPALSFFTSRLSFDYSRFLFSAGIWLIMTVLLLTTAMFFSKTTVVWNYDPTKFWVLLLLAIILTPIQTLFEEWLCRSFLLKFFGSFLKKGIVVCLCSTAVFGLLHMGNAEVNTIGLSAIAFYVASGLLLSVITLMDEGIELAWGFHFMNNFFLFVFFTADSSSFQTAALFRDTGETANAYDILITMFVCFPLFLLILSKKYRWKDWKKRLF